MKTIFSLFLSLSFLIVGAVAQEYVIDEDHSNVEFSVKHMMISTVKGIFEDYEANISFDPASKTFKKVEAAIDADSIDTNNDKRDDHLESADFFEVEKYPKIYFTMTSYDKKTQIMHGTLTIKNNKKPIELQTKINGIIKDMEGNERVGFTLKGKVNRKDFGLKWNKILETGGLLIGDEVNINIEIQMVAI